MEDSEVEMVKVHTKENPANTLTNFLPHDGFRKCVALMQLVNKMKLTEALKHQGGDCFISYGSSKAQETKTNAKVQ